MPRIHNVADCPICFDAIVSNGVVTQPTLVLHCGDVYHVDCLKQCKARFDDSLALAGLGGAATAQSQFKCPTCRRVLTDGDNEDLESSIRDRERKRQRRDEGDDESDTNDPVEGAVAVLKNCWYSSVRAQSRAIRVLDALPRQELDAALLRIADSEGALQMCAFQLSHGMEDAKSASVVMLHLFLRADLSSRMHGLSVPASIVRAVINSLNNGTHRLDLWYRRRIGLLYHAATDPVLKCEAAKAPILEMCALLDDAFDHGGGEYMREARNITLAKMASGGGDFKLRAAEAGFLERAVGEIDGIEISTLPFPLRGSRGTLYALAVLVQGSHENALAACEHGAVGKLCNLVKACVDLSAYGTSSELAYRSTLGMALHVLVALTDAAPHEIIDPALRQCVLPMAPTFVHLFCDTVHGALNCSGSCLAIIDTLTRYAHLADEAAAEALASVKLVEVLLRRAEGAEPACAPERLDRVERLLVRTTVLTRSVPENLALRVASRVIDAMAPKDPISNLFANDANRVRQLAVGGVLPEEPALVWKLIDQLLRCSTPRGRYQHAAIDALVEALQRLASTERGLTAVKKSCKRRLLNQYARKIAERPSGAVLRGVLDRAK